MLENNVRDNSMLQLEELFVGLNKGNETVYKVFEDGEVTLGDATVLVTLATDYKIYKTAFEGLNTINLDSILNKEDLPKITGDIFNLVDGIVRTYDHSAPAVLVNAEASIKEIKELLVGIVRVNKAIGEILEDGKVTISDLTSLVNLAKDYSLLQQAVVGLNNVDIKSLLSKASTVEVTALTYDFVSEIIATYRK